MSTILGTCTGNFFRTTGRVTSCSVDGQLYDKTYPVTLSCDSFGTEISLGLEKVSINKLYEIEIHLDDNGPFELFSYCRNEKYGQNDYSFRKFTDTDKSNYVSYNVTTKTDISIFDIQKHYSFNIKELS